MSDVNQISVVAIFEGKELEYVYYQNGTATFYKLEKLDPDEVAQLLKNLNREIKTNQL